MVSKIYTRETDVTPGIAVALSGEFDIGELDLLSKTLDSISHPGPPASVDLSGVTFLDVCCTRELAAHLEFCGGRLRLGGLSWQAAASFKACGYGDQTSTRRDTEISHDVMAAAS